MATEPHPCALFLTLNGIPREAPPEDGGLFFIFTPMGEWKPCRGDRSVDIDTVCVLLHDAIAAAIMGSLSSYHALLPIVPSFLADAGMNSESPMSRREFEEAMPHVPHQVPRNQLLYMYDCRKLVSSIQECTKEVVHLQGEFYRALNLDELFYPPVAEADGVRWITSPVTTKLHATLGFLYVRLHSLLDYLTKLAWEVEHLQSDFTAYPRLSSRNALFGKKNRLVSLASNGTVFESCPVVREVEVFRNHIIHDGLLDDMPKAYKEVSGGKTVAKFILLPDRGTEGHLEKYINRTLFYGKEDRINLRLPELVSGFQERQLATLEEILRLALEKAKGSPKSQHEG